MKGAGTLLLLVSLAVAAGLVLYLKRDRNPAAEEPAAEGPAAERYVEKAIGLPFKVPPSIETVSQNLLLKEVEENLRAQFGPGGLARRARALELLGFEDTASRNLSDEMIAMEAGGVRGWFDEDSGRLLVPADFDKDNVFDGVVLHGLLTRLLLHQHAPTTIGRLPDDEWIARRSLHQAVSESLEASLRREHREAFALPTPIQTEREAVILALPTYLHQVAQLPLENGAARVFLEARVRTGARALGDLVREPPRTTFELLGGDPGLIPPPPRLPTPEGVLLDESLGAFGVQALLEWLESYEQAQALALLWRGDRYRLFANPGGDHLLWVCRWETPQAATRAAEILSGVPPSDDEVEPRAVAVTIQGRLTVMANCSDPATLEELQRTDWGGLNPDPRPGPLR